MRIRVLWERKIEPRMSLRAIFVVPFVLMMVSAVGLTGYLSLRNGQRAVDNLARQLQAQILASIERDLTHFLAMPHRLNRLNAEALRRNPRRIENFDELRADYLRKLQVFESVMTSAVGIEASGEFLGMGRRPDGAFDSAFVTRDSGSVYRHYLLDAEGRPGKLLATIVDYDVRARPWYKTALEAGKAAWSPIYIWAAGTNIGITAVLPVYDDAGSLLVVQQAALSLHHIGQFLKGLRIGRTGRVFLMEGSGMLVASSTPEEPVRQGQDGGVLRVKATESQEPLVQAAAQYLGSHFGGLDRVPERHQASIAIAGERHFLQTAVFESAGLNWIIVVDVPEADFMGEIDANTRQTILLSGLALLAAIGLGVVTAHWITAPILSLNVASRELARGGLEPAGPGPSQGRGGRAWRIVQLDGRSDTGALPDSGATRD